MLAAVIIWVMTTNRPNRPRSCTALAQRMLGRVSGLFGCCSASRRQRAATTLGLDDESSQRATGRVDGAGSRDASGDYVVEERQPDGRVVLRPDLSVPESFRRCSSSIPPVRRRLAHVTPTLGTVTDLRHGHERHAQPCGVAPWMLRAVRGGATCLRAPPGRQRS